MKSPSPLPVTETVRVVRDVLAPTIVRGAVRRRPEVVSNAERRDLDRRAIDRLRMVRDRFGDGPALLRFPLPERNLVVLLSASDVSIALSNTPCPFSTVTPEKRAALRHFQPRGALVSDGPERTPRRRLHELALEDAARRASVAPTIHAAADALGTRLALALADRCAEGGAGGGADHRLEWCDFASAWSEYVAHVVFGPDADTSSLERRLLALRRAGNWAYAHPQRGRTRARLHGQIATLRTSAPPWTLAGPLSEIESSAVEAPDDQIAHWLFAFDAASMATWRALAAVLAGPAGVAGAGALSTDELCSAVLESLRLWPTTPVILREQTAPVEWTSGVVTDAGTSCVVFAPFFHRGEELEEPDAFVPARWSRTSPAVLDGSLALVPFSAGPAVCPGRHVVLDMAAAAMRSLVDALPHNVRVDSRTSLDLQNTPTILDPFGLALQVVRPASDPPVPMRDERSAREFVHTS